MIKNMKIYLTMVIFHSYVNVYWRVWYRCLAEFTIVVVKCCRWSNLRICFLFLVEFNWLLATHINPVFAAVVWISIHCWLNFTFDNINYQFGLHKSNLLVASPSIYGVLNHIKYMNNICYKSASSVKSVVHPQNR